MRKRYVAVKRDGSQPLYSKIGGGLTKNLQEAEVINWYPKALENWNRLGFELEQIQIMKENSNG